jgi:hypothetical protein
MNASSFVMSDASLIVITNAVPLFRSISSNEKSFDIVIAYLDVTSEGSEHLVSLEDPFLHVGNLSVPGLDLQTPHAPSGGRKMPHDVRM